MKSWGQGGRRGAGLCKSNKKTVNQGKGGIILSLGEQNDFKLEEKTPHFSLNLNLSFFSYFPKTDAHQLLHHTDLQLI